MKNLKSIKLATGAMLISTTIVLPTISNAAEDFQFKFSGQVSRAFSYADNGVDDDVLVVDNNNSGTRIRLTGSVKVRPGLKAGVNIESQFQDNSSSSLDIGDADNSSGAFSSRKRELWFKGGFGKVTLGQGDGAANGTSEVDFSGTTIADYSGQNLDDGISFTDSDGNRSINQGGGGAFSNFDGLSRNDRLRYDTPHFGPLAAAISVGQDRSEFAVRYSQKLGGGSKLGGAIGYVSSDGQANTSADFKQLGLSVSYLTASGFNITGHYGEQDRDDGREDPEGIYIKVGQKFGAHNVSLAYHSVDDNNTDGDEAERVNLAYVFHIKKGIELFATYQTSSLDRATGPSQEDIDQVVLGSRIKF